MNTVNITKEMIRRGVTEVVYLDSIISNKWTRDDLIKVIDVIKAGSVIAYHPKRALWMFAFSVKAGIMFVEKENNDKIIVCGTEETRHYVILTKSQVRIIDSLPSVEGRPWIFGYRDDL